MTTEPITLRQFESLSLLSEFLCDMLKMEYLKDESETKYGNRTINVDFINFRLTTKAKFKN